VNRRIFYNSHATADVYDVIRQAMPPGFDLVTLAADDDAERIARVADADVILTAAYRLKREVIDAARRVVLVHHQGVGYQDTVDVAALRERRLPLALTPEGTTTGVAEHTVLLVLAILRRLPFADSELRLGRFHINALRSVSFELAGKTVGYLGMGRIGQAVAARLVPFGTTGLYFDPAARLDAVTERTLGVQPVPFDELLARADVLTLHLPLTAASRHLIDEAAIARMKRGAFLVNTARGGIVDERALAAALADGRLGGAALDVYETEPMPVGHPLALLPNVVLTPHIAAGTRDAMLTKMRAIGENIARFFRGEPLANEVKW
jgi:phosphoglycerate dehydrogenase-like enzyme